MTTIDQTEIPITAVVPVASLLDWAHSVDASLGQSSSWAVDELPAGAGPATIDTARFDTMGTPYTASGDAQWGELQVFDDVTFTGSIELGGGVDVTLPTGALTDLHDDGSMTVAAGASIVGSHAAIIGASSAGALTIAGRVSEDTVVVGGGSDGSIDVTGAGASLTATTSLVIGGTSSGSVTVENGGSLDVSKSFGLLVSAGGTLALDGSATLAPTAIDLDGGLLMAVGGATGGNVTMTSLLDITAGDVGHVGSDGGVLTLNGLILGGGSLQIDGGEVRLGIEAGFLGKIAVALNGGTLDSNGILGGGAGDITTMADTINTVRLTSKSINIASNGTDLLQLSGSIAAITTTGIATIDSYVRELDLQADSGQATVEMKATGTASLTGSASATVLASAGGTVDATSLLGAFSYLATAALNVTVLAGAGATSITSGTGTADIVLGAGSADVRLFGDDTVHTGSGSATVSAMGADTVSVAVSGGGGSLTFLGGAGAATVGGGAGSATLTGGTGGSVLFSGHGGNSLLQAGGGSAILIGIADGDTLVGASGGANILFAGAGAETLVAGDAGADQHGTNIIIGGSGPDLIEVNGYTTVFGGAGGNDTITGQGVNTIIVSSGNDTIQSTSNYQAVFGSASGGDVITGGGGTNILIAGGGAETLQGGGASSLIFGTGGTDVFGTGDGASTIVSGAGQSTVNGGGASSRSTVAGTTGDMTVNGGAGQLIALTETGATTFNLQSGGLTVYEVGAGAATYNVTAGQAGGDLFITGFRADTDTLNLSGYAPSQLSQSLAGGSSVLSLNDGTTITLVGVTTTPPLFV